MLFPFKVENGKCQGTMELEKNEYLIYMNSCYVVSQLAIGS